MMNPSMALCQSLDATLATTRLWLHRTQFHDVPRPQAYAFAYLDDRLRKSKNNYFYCRWQDSGTMELDGPGWNWMELDPVWTCFPELDTCTCVFKL